MQTLVSSVGILLFSLTGCSEKTITVHDTGPGASDRWANLSPIPLEAFRLMRQTSFPQAASATQLLTDEIHGPAFLMDQAAGFVWATDKLFLHDPRISCLHPSDPSKIAFVGDNGSCPPDTISTRRARLDIGHESLAMAMDQARSRLAIIGQDAQLFWIEVDPMQGSAIDHMRPVAGPHLTRPGNPLVSPLLAVYDKKIGLAEGAEVSIFSETGIRETVFDAVDPVVSLHINEAGWWALTEEMLFLNGAPSGPGGHALTFWDSQAWVQSGQTLYGPAGEVTIEDMTGPMAAWSDRLLVSTSTGLVSVNSRLEVDEVWSGDAVDIATNQANEVVILEPNNRLSIYVDERPLEDATTLHMWLNTFIEHPRESREHKTCSDDERSEIEAIHELAAAQLVLLHDLPVQTALGITPSHMNSISRCTSAKDIMEISEGVEVGVLFHDTPTHCVDNPACYIQEIEEILSTYMMEISWVSGLPSHTEIDVDWVESVSEVLAPPPLNFFSASIQPTLPHTSDLRSKESWPMTIADHTRSWRAGSVDQVAIREQEGALSILPGNNISAFNLGACPNLFITECHALNRGEGESLSNRDIESLDLLVHRALTSARGPGVHTWSFHLPDIGIYDFTENCEVSSGLWFGEECEGARLQGWLTDLHQRFALDGRISWSTPSNLP